MRRTTPSTSPKVRLGIATLGALLCCSNTALAYQASPALLPANAEPADLTVVPLPESVLAGEMGAEQPSDANGSEPGEPNLGGDALGAHDLAYEIVPVSGSDNTITIKGRLFYEDHRKHGQFDRREDLGGSPGLARGDRDQDPVRPAQWLLGAYHMVIDIYERDQQTVFPGCKNTDLIKSVMVRADGSFSASFSFTDDCKRSDWNRPKFSIRARTRYCDANVCFQVGQRNNHFYELWWRKDNPVGVARGTTHDFGDLVFSQAGAPAKNDYARAANQFASIADAISTLHHEGDIPFRQASYGGLQVRFPSSYSSGRATDYDLIDLDNTGWPSGQKAIHEYGHIVHRRAWGGDYAGHHDPIQHWTSSSSEAPFIAMKEGWAVFVQNYVLGKCAKPSYDTNYDFKSTARGVKGNNFVENHHRFFCDWIDANSDLRPSMHGAGDIMQATLWSLWHNLDRMDNTVNQYGGHDPVDPGLGVCDFAGYYLNVRKSAAEVGQALHDHYVWNVSSLLEQHDLRCQGIPKPSELREHDYGVALFPNLVDDSTLDDTDTGTRVVSMQADVSNLHAYITSGYALIIANAIYEDGASVEVDRAYVSNIRAGQTLSRSFEVDVLMDEGTPIPVRVVISVTDPMGLDTDLSNNSAAFVLDADSLRPNLTVHATEVVLGEPGAHDLSFTAVITNTGLTEAEFGDGLVGSLWKISESTGALHQISGIHGTLAVGQSRELAVSLELTDDVFVGITTWVAVDVDTNDAVPELRESDNTARIPVVTHALIELPTLEVLVLDNTELVRSAMWVQQLQRDLLRSFVWQTDMLWTYESPVDRAFAHQLSESTFDPMLASYPLQVHTQASVFINPGLLPVAASPQARSYAQQWRALP